MGLKYQTDVRELYIILPVCTYSSTVRHTHNDEIKKTHGPQIFFVRVTFTHVQIEKKIDNTIRENVTAEWLLCKLHSQKPGELQQRVRVGEGLLPTEVQGE